MSQQKQVDKVSTHPHIPNIPMSVGVSSGLGQPVLKVLTLIVTGFNLISNYCYFYGFSCERSWSTTSHSGFAHLWVVVIIKRKMRFYARPFLSSYDI